MFKHSDYVKEYFSYYNSGSSAGLKRYETSDGVIQEYIYNEDRLLREVKEVRAGQSYIKASYEYDYAKRLISSRDGLGRTTSFSYDNRDRLVSTTYNDDSTELKFYGTGVDANLLIKEKNRNGVTTSYEYDSVGRKIKQINSYSQMSTDGSSEVMNATDIQGVITYEYLTGTNLVSRKEELGKVSVYVYDYRNRVIEEQMHLSSSESSSLKKIYVNNRLFCEEDEYGRKSYSLYRSSDNRLIRKAIGLTTHFSIENNKELRNLSREEGGNYDLYDYNYDKQGRITSYIDKDGKERSFNYNARGEMISFSRDTSRDTYYPDGNLEASYDRLGNKTTYFWHNCCGRLQAVMNNDGSGEITNVDYLGNMTHKVKVSNVLAS